VGLGKRQLRKLAELEQRFIIGSSPLTKEQEDLIIQRDKVQNMINDIHNKRVRLLKVEEEINRKLAKTMG